MALTKTFTTLSVFTIFVLVANAKTPTPSSTPEVTPHGSPPSTAKPVSQANDLASPRDKQPPPAATRTPAGPPPKPVLYLLRQEYYSTGGKNWIRYRYDVLNKA